MTHIAYEPAEKCRQWSYQGVSVRRYHTNRVWYEFTIDTGFGREFVVIYGKLIEARRSIDALLEPRSEMSGVKLPIYEAHQGKLALKGLYK